MEEVSMSEFIARVVLAVYIPIVESVGWAKEHATVQNVALLPAYGVGAGLGFGALVADVTVAGVLRRWLTWRRRGLWFAQ